MVVQKYQVTDEFLLSSSTDDMSYIHFLLSSFLLTSLMCGFSCHFLIAFQAVC